jgi:hypothetical protein
MVANDDIMTDSTLGNRFRRSARQRVAVSVAVGQDSASRVHRICSGTNSRTPAAS